MGRETDGPEVKTQTGVGLFLAAALALSACSGSDGGEDNSARDAVLGSSSTTPPTTTSTAQADPDPRLAGLGGLIATTDAAGMQLIDPTTGEIESQFVEDGIVTQPTWSRDGSSLVAMAVEPDTLAGQLLLVDVTAGTSRQVPVSRPYFFFSWSPDGTMIAALGPALSDSSAASGTALDILDTDGNVVSTGDLSGGSLYVAWAPDSSSILAHRDDSLLHLDDPTLLQGGTDLGTSGALFQAPAWIPGTRSALIAVESPTGTRLARIDVDTGEQIDLGPAQGFVNFAVSADGRRAVVAHSPNATGSANVSVAPVQEGQPGGVTALVEILDLDTGDRTAVSDVPALWVEWNPAGTAVAVYLIDGAWSVWSDGELQRLDESVPTQIFFQRYVLFSGQYVESPRLWSPDGDAITYSANTGTESRFFVLPVDGAAEPTAVDLGTAHVAFWSPGG